jgi:uncharacterized protein YlzI (FlbEa/FlbD family)
MKNRISLIVIILITIVVLFVLNSYLNDSVREFVKEYNKPDTTITIHNGKSDTTIVIKK